MAQRMKGCPFVAGAIGVFRKQAFKTAREERRALFSLVNSGPGASPRTASQSFNAFLAVDSNGPG